MRNLAKCFSFFQLAVFEHAPNGSASSEMMIAHMYIPFTLQIQTRVSVPNIVGRGYVMDQLVILALTHFKSHSRNKRTGNT